MMSSENIRSPDIAVFISGRGSNLLKLLEKEKDGTLKGRIRYVYSDKKIAPGLEHAAAFGKECGAFPFNTAGRDSLLAILGREHISLVVLAGFMRVLPADFIKAFKGVIVNIHPALLPSFPGLDAQKQAFEHGVKISGATVHIVDDTLDGGPIILQHACSIEGCASAEEVSARILKIEHELYAKALNLILNVSWKVEGRRFIYED